MQAVGLLVHEQRFTSLLVDFARALVTTYPVDSRLQELCVRIPEVLPVSGAGVMLEDETGSLHFVAASDDTVGLIESLQIELGEGPCSTAYDTGEQVLVPDLTHTDRFPRFAPRALGVGLAAIFSFPMRLDDEHVGALNLYRDRAGPLEDGDVDSGQVLADIATAYILNARGRVESERAIEELRYRALHDALTGLPNRTLLHDRIEHAVAAARRQGSVPALLFIDLDRFKVINDSLGHHVGDDLLKAIARRIQAGLRPGDTLARLGGDEFVVLCEGLDEAARATVVAKRIGAELAQPFTVGNEEVVVGASIGLAMATGGEVRAEALLQDADAAMYRAKQRGGGRFEIIDDEVRAQAQRRLRFERDLRRAAQRGELRLLYQPIVAVSSERFHRFEALLRWEHPDEGCMAPGQFLALAEETGAIIQVGQWVLREACRALGRWSQRDDVGRLNVAVNISARELMAPGFADSVAVVLEETGTDPRTVCLEITEAVLTEDSDAAMAALVRLKELGVELGVDDFGAGCSSLGYLKRLPVDVVKVDRAFVHGLGATPEDFPVLNAVLSMAHALDLDVVAEGVETGQQLTEIRALGCDYAQGYFLAKPMTADAVNTLLDRRATAE